MAAQNPPRQPEFPTTHWSLVYRAGHGSERNAALNELLERYLPALRAFLTGARRVRQQEVDDILHGFIADKMIQDQLISHANQYRGRFRTFLLSVLDNYTHNLHRYESSQRRSPRTPQGNVESVPVTDAKALPPDRQFDIAWARSVVQQAVDRMRRECVAESRNDLWQIFSDRILAPLLEETPPVPYEELVAKYHYKTPGEVYNALTTAKRMFVRNLRAIVGEYAKDETEIEEELRELRAVLANTRA